MLYTQYHHSLNDQWAVAPRLSFAVGKSGEALDPTVVGSGVYQQFSAVALDLDFNYQINVRSYVTTRVVELFVFAETNFLLYQSVLDQKRMARCE